MNETLARLLDAAREDSLLREELLASEKAKDPMSVKPPRKRASP